MATRTQHESASDTLELWRIRAAQLERALDSRIVIEQAKGVLAERYALTMAEARTATA